MWSHNVFYNWLGNTAALYLCKPILVGQKKKEILWGNGIEKITPEKRHKTSDDYAIEFWSLVQKLLTALDDQSSSIFNIHDETCLSTPVRDVNAQRLRGRDFFFPQVFSDLRDTAFWTCFLSAVLFNICSILCYWGIPDFSVFLIIINNIELWLWAQSTGYSSHRSTRIPSVKPSGVPSFLGSEQTFSQSRQN